MEDRDLIEVILGLLFFVVVPILRAIAERKKKKAQEAKWAQQAEQADEAYPQEYQAEQETEYGEVEPLAPAPPPLPAAPFAAPFGAPTGSSQMVTQLIGEVDELASRADRLATDTRIDRATYRFSPVLDDFVVAEARRLQAAAELGGWPYQQLSGGLEALHIVFAQIEDLVAQRRDPELLPLVGDADALALACYEPIVEFARAHQIKLTSMEPVCDLGERDLGSWTGFIPTGLAPLALPPDFFDRIAWWPALAHEIAHDFLAAAEGVHDQLRLELGLPNATAGRWPLRFGGEGIASAELYRLFAGWFEELFCDVFGTLMVGPAYGWAMLELFPSPANPGAIVAVTHDDSGMLYDPHPPRHLRLVVTSYLLEQMGRAEEAEEMREQWARLHGGWPSAILFPVGRQWVPVPSDAVAAMAVFLAEQLYRQAFKALSGYRLCDIPGVDFGPHASAETNRVAHEILEGEVPHKTDARWLVAGATEAWRLAPDREAEIIGAVRRAILAVGTFEHAEDAYALDKRPGKVSVAVVEAREAFLLHTILGPPVAMRPHAGISAQ